VLAALVDRVAPTAYAQGGGQGADYGNATWPGQVGTPPFTALEDTRLGPVMPQNNFELPIPLVSLGGRGLATRLIAYYNSSVWGAYFDPIRNGTVYVFDPIQGWPGTGFSHRSGVSMVITRSDSLRALLGGVAFWLPSIIMHALRGYDFSAPEERALSFIEPLTTLATFVLICLVQRKRATLKRCALWILLGIWILGPACLFLSATFAGGGFAKNPAWIDLLVATVFFPVVTPWMSLYDGSFVGLLVTSLILGAASLDLPAILFRRGRSPIS
jgi:hypothetical protein